MKQMESARNLDWAQHVQSTVATDRIGLLRAALAIAPEAADRRSDLAWEYFELGDLDEALRVAGEATAPPSLLQLRGLCAHSQDRFDAARTLLSAACAQGVDAWSDLAEAMAYAGDEAGASDLCRKLLRANPGDFAPLRVECGRLIRAGDVAALNALCDALSAQGVSHAGHVATKIAAMALLGDLDPAEQAQDYATKLHVGTLDLGPGFNAALAAEILGHPNRAGVAMRRSTVGGERVETPLIDAAPILNAIAAAIQKTATPFLFSLGEMVPADVLAGERQLRLKIWAVILKDGGYQKWHVHPTALVSGVYYAAFPPTDAALPDAGALEFDLLSTGYDGRPVLPHRVRPETGTLVMFPSYFVHRTIPTQSPAPRISVAFDIFAA